MKHIILVNGKPIEQLTEKEKQLLDKQIERAAKKYFGLVYSVDKVHKASE